ncbi:hypothetical protein [Nannocystis punicea]|uniref:Uncharacterized protein n=1 Tax=Nannocystis punicea TaxID=2995304 RepID=A0ABY7GUX6_9BACT|nr:hypothetical protein [Nannocystis poenicansa]WAS90756.1 hypothetical protein O0S08_31600 [Nannocystis poenicansa]
MQECADRRPDRRPGAHGEYRVGHGDAAPGWNDWMWQVEAIEPLERPIAGVLARYRELESAELAHCQLAARTRTTHAPPTTPASAPQEPRKHRL